MPPFGPITRRDLIAALRALGFDGPRPGADHAFMVGRGHRIPIPNPHRGDIGRGFLARILREAEISRAEWESV